MWEILTGEEPYADMHCGAIIGKFVTDLILINWKIIHILILGKRDEQLCYNAVHK